MLCWHSEDNGKCIWRRLRRVGLAVVDVSFTAKETELDRIGPSQPPGEVSDIFLHVPDIGPWKRFNSFNDERLAIIWPPAHLC